MRSPVAKQIENMRYAYVQDEKLIAMTAENAFYVFDFALTSSLPNSDFVNSVLAK